MRITQGMLSNNMLRNLSNSYTNLDKYLNQLSTGKKINKPSDDPVVAMKGMGYRTQITEVEQFQRNTNEVNNWMDNSDAALDKATKALQKMRELAVQASNDTYDKEQRINIMEEVNQLKEHLIDIANTKVNDKYIFNGTNTGTAPITIGQDNDDTGTAPVTADQGPMELIIDYSNAKPVMIEVSKGTKLQANVDPASVFGEDLFENIDGFISVLQTNNQESIEQSIGNLDLNIDNIINARADLGARMNRLELVENRLGEQEVIARKMMTENENVDIEKAITELITQESLQRAALSAGARIIQPTLLDFLR